MTGDHSSQPSRSQEEQDLDALRFVERVLPLPALLLTLVVTARADDVWLTGVLAVVFVGFNVGLSQLALRRGRAASPRANAARIVIDMALLLVIGITAGPECPSILMSVPLVCAAPFLFRDRAAWFVIVGVIAAGSLGNFLGGATMLELAPTAFAEVIVGSVLVAAVVELRRREAEREQALAEARRLAKVKSEFLAVMSHEVRSPLHGMLGTLSLLDTDSVDEVNRERLATIAECGEEMLRVLSDVLQLSQMQSGDVELPRRQISVPELVDDALERVAKLALERDVALRRELEDGMALLVEGPADAITQVLDRMLHNAVSFTRGGLVTVYVSSVPKGLRFSVVDTGAGIPPAALTGIFDAFTQVDPSTTRAHGGTGVGLTICKKIVDQLGGEIEATSEVGKGSRFSFTVPCEEVAETEPDMQVVARRATRPTPTELPVLVVDDSPINRRVMTGMLERLGYSVDTADDGRQAVERAESGDYPVILMDCYMPVMDGFEATKMIRERHGRRFRIIGVTANALPDARQRCLEAGMDAYVPKPVSLQQLGSIMEE